MYKNNCNYLLFNYIGCGVTPCLDSPDNVLFIFSYFCQQGVDKIRFFTNKLWLLLHFGLKKKSTRIKKCTRSSHFGQFLFFRYGFGKKRLYVLLHCLNPSTLPIQILLISKLQYFTDEEIHTVDLSSLSNKLLPGLTTLGFKDDRRHKGN